MDTPLFIFNQKEIEPTDYVERKTVKAVVIGKDDKTLVFPSTLIGGGVEGDETYEEALHREALEEAGAEVEIIKPIGEIIGYRDSKKQKYVVKGFLCKFIKTISTPTTTDEKELLITAAWENPKEVIARLESQIQDLRIMDQSQYDIDTYQAKLHNREISLAFLKAVFE